MAEEQRAFIPPKRPNTDYPVSMKNPLGIAHVRLTVSNRLLTLIRTSQPLRANNNHRSFHGSLTNIGIPYSHWRRAFGYARPEDWTYGAGVAAIGPAFMLLTERYAPSFAGKGAFPPVFRLSVGIGLLAGAGMVYQRSCRTSQYTYGMNYVEIADG